jgi:hypothetical protein
MSACTRLTALILLATAVGAQLNVPDAPTSVALDVLSGSEFIDAVFFCLEMFLSDPTANSRRC